MNNLIIGIAGGSGSGKTTLALRLKERFGEDEVRLIAPDLPRQLLQAPRRAAL